MIQNHQFAILLPLLVGMGAHALNDFAIIALVISVAFVAHLVEIGLWAILLVLCKEFQELGTAYYHSAVNYTTLGYGDLLLSPAWRLLGPLEATNGALMFGVSAAVVFAAVQRLVLARFQDLRN
jgi:ion channel